jgi:hypothetical protein
MAGITGVGFAEEGVGFGGEIENVLRGCEADVGVGAGAIVWFGGGVGHRKLRRWWWAKDQGWFPPA